MTNLLNRRRLLWLVPGIVVSAVGVSTAKMMRMPADLDLALSKLTDNGHYIGSIEPGLSPIKIGKIHAWTVQVTTPKGKPVEHAQITINGGMPRHGHGLPTKPRMTAELGGGRYQIDGMKFNMRGWWTVTVSVSGPAGPDTLTFNLIL